MGHVERKERERDNIRKSLLQAAIDIAKKEGWQGVTIRKIADAVEYTTSIVYGHFESKEALMQEIVDNGFSKLYRHFIKTYDEHSDPCEQLMDLSLFFWDFASKNKELYQLMLSQGKPLSKSATEATPMIVGIFSKLIGQSDTEVYSLMLNWMCLREGAITRLLYFSENSASKENRDLYKGFMERFISSINSKNVKN